MPSRAASMTVSPSDWSPGDPRRREEVVGATRKEGAQRPGLRALEQALHA